MEVEHWEGSFNKNNNYIPPRSFRIYLEVTKVDINMKMHGLRKKYVFKNYYIRQYGVLVNIATTGHKLQGMSKDNVIVVSWFYGVKNWVYVVLSRVRTLSGLYLFKPLDPKKYHKQDNKLTKHMNELASKEEKTLASVKEIPKNSLVFENIHSITTIPNMDCKSLESKRLRNNKRKTTKSSHVSIKLTKQNRKNQASPEKNSNQISQSKTALVDSDVRDLNRISPLILDSVKWGRDDGAHCLPSIFQINTLR